MLLARLGCRRRTRDAQPSSSVGIPAVGTAAEQSVEAVDGRLRAVLEQTAVPGEREGHAVVPGPLRHITHVAAGRRGGWPGGPAGRADCCTYCCTGLSMSAGVGRSRSLPMSASTALIMAWSLTAVTVEPPRESSARLSHSGVHEVPAFSHSAAPIAGMEWCVSRKRSAIWPKVVDGRERQTGHRPGGLWRRRARRGLTPSKGLHGRPSRCPVACPTSRRRARSLSWWQPLICGSVRRLRRWVGGRTPAGLPPDEGGSDGWRGDHDNEWVHNRHHDGSVAPR